MTWKNYLEINRTTTKYCLKICGVLFTSIYATIAIVLGYQNQSMADAIEIFLISCLLGNGIGLIIFSLAIFVSYRQTQSIIALFATIPESIKEKYGLTIFTKPRDHRFYFLEVNISYSSSQLPVIFEYHSGQKKVQIIIVLKTDSNRDIQRSKTTIRKKYGKSDLSLTNLGLQKSIKRKKWNNASAIEIQNYISELIEVTKEEGLEIQNATGFIEK